MKNNNNTYILKVRELLHEQRVNEAVLLLKKYIHENVDNYLFVYELALIYARTKQNNLLKELLEGCILKNPKNLNFLLLLSNFYFNNVNLYLNESIETYLKIISLNHIDALICYRLAFLYSKKLDNDNCLKFLYLSYKVNKESNKFNLLLQYEIISSILFKFNYLRVKNFYSLYFDKMNEFSELRLGFVKQYKQWSKTQSKKIRLGFVSGDFRDHAVCIFITSLLKNLNRDKYDIYLYTTVNKEDDYTKKIKEYCDKYTYVNLFTSELSANLIYEDNIDILFDLSGHTAHSGLILFKYKPAPIQISWLGYFSSTGIPEMDYFLTSKYCVLEQEDKYFTEKIIRLPESHLSYDFLEYKITNTLNHPFESNKYFTFGIFQNLNKISDQDVKIWRTILKKIDSAQIVIKAQGLSNEILKQEFINKLNKFNIDMKRIKLIGKTTFEEYLEHHNNIDIMLDLYNVSGCTTTCQSLYMGVPVMTFKGFSMTTRYGEQFNKILKLEQFIAEDINDFTRKLILIISKPLELKHIKDTLREKVLTSSIGNNKKFNQQFEDVIDKLIKNP